VPFHKEFDGSGLRWSPQTQSEARGSTAQKNPKYLSSLSNDPKEHQGARTKAAMDLFSLVFLRGPWWIHVFPLAFTTAA
jgi:hypothetical protein